MKILLRSVVVLALLTVAFSMAHASLLLSPQLSRPDILTLGLVGHWTFESPTVGFSGGTSTFGDSSITIRAATTSTAKLGVGKMGQGLQLNGVNDYASTAGDGALNLTAAFSVSAWGRAVSSAGYLVQKYGNAGGIGTKQWDLHMTSFTVSDGLFDFQGSVCGTNGDCSAACPIPRSYTAWHLYTGVFSGSQIICYVDGVAGTPNNTTIPVPSRTTPIEFGRWRAGEYFKGAIDDVRIYNRALAASEVRQLYAQGSVGALTNKQKTDPVSLQTNLIGHWAFDGKDTGATYTLDTSGGGNTAFFGNSGTTAGDGTTVGNPVRTISGKIGQALYFDPTLNFATIGTAYSGSTGTFRCSQLGGNKAYLSLAAWVKLDPRVSPVGNVRPIFTRTTDEQSWNTVCGGAGPGVKREIAFQVAANNTFQLSLSSIGTVTSDMQLATSTWYHLAAVYDKDLAQIKLYANGALVKTGSVTAANTDNTLLPTGIGMRHIWYGHTPYPIQKFTGSIDDVRLYDRALSGSDVLQIYKQGVAAFTPDTKKGDPANLLSGLVGYWTFDGKDKFGNEIYDTNPNATKHTGTLYGASPTAGKMGQGMTFGTSAYASFGNDIFSNAVGTITAWIRINDFTTLKDIYVAEVPASSWLGFMIAGNKLRAQCNGCGNVIPGDAGIGYVMVSNGTINDMNWHHVAMSSDNNTWSLYLDGVKQGLTDGNPNNGNVGKWFDDLYANAEHKIGYRAGGGERLNGAIDELRIYNRQLSDTEVLQLYKAGK